MVTFSSFEHSHRHKGEKFSIACFQPKGFNYEELTCLAPYDENFESLRSKGFVSKDKSLCDYERYELAFDGFSKTIFKAYLTRWSEIYYWLKSLLPEKDLVLCCWCPESKGAKEQLAKVGVFVCHCGLVAKMITTYRQDIQVYYDASFKDMESSPWESFDLPSGMHIERFVERTIGNRPEHEGVNQKF